MRKFSQYFLVLLAMVWVWVLGYYAYFIATDTLVMSFVGQEYQQWNSIRVAVSKPWMSLKKNTSILDPVAIERSILKNGQPWKIVSWEWKVRVDDSSFSIHTNGLKKGDRFMLSSALYNKQKNTPWRLSRDISSVIVGKDPIISVQRVGLPRDLTYTVALSWFKGLNIDDLRWYIREDIDFSSHNRSHRHKNIKLCSLQNWDADNWKKINTTPIESFSNAEGAIGTYKLDLWVYPQNACIIMGMWGHFYTIPFFDIPDFTASGKIVSTLSPEYNMKTRIDFRFSTDIYTDSWALYSPEYIENRRLAKVDFLKRLSVSQGIEVDEKSLELSPNKATMYLELKEWQLYTVKLQNLKDIYGRTTNTKLNVTPQSIPYLSLRLDKNKTIWRTNEPIKANIFHVKTKKQEYEVKLCKMNLEWYARMERINEIAHKDFLSASYDILSSSDARGCVKKTIALKQDNYISWFDVASLYPKKLTPWLYILAFRNKSDVENFDRFVAAIPFSVIDTNITMKIDSGGDVNFLVTDINTGKPRKDQTITLKNNIGRIYNARWNSKNRKTEYDYVPLSNKAFWTGVVVGKTDDNGVLNLTYSDLHAKMKHTQMPSFLYEMTSDWKDREGRYHSFLATTQWQGHYGYVLSTWNDGITGWNFGFKSSDYSWFKKSHYNVYAHTDRKLYLPWETVYYKAILRKNNSQLDIPSNEIFDINITDSNGKSVHNSRVKSNDFWSITTRFLLDANARLWRYYIDISSQKYPNIYIDNSRTSFQVEIFKNPTFTANIKLSSPQIRNDTVINIRKSRNVNARYMWYDSVYTSQFTLEGIVWAKYYNGATLKSVPFTYRVYKSRLYDISYWRDCFWGCHYTPSLEFYTEWEGSIDSDGVWAFRVPIGFSSYSHDYTYTVEVTITDPLSWEQVTTPSTIIAKLPSKYRLADMDHPLVLQSKNKILKPWETFVAHVKPKYGNWDDSLSGQYIYELIQRTHVPEDINSLRTVTHPIMRTVDTVVATQTIDVETIKIDTTWYAPGQYILRLSPKVASWKKPPSQSISESELYIIGDFRGASQRLSVIPEKTIYTAGETARVMIHTPFASGGYLYLTRERWGVIDGKYIPLDGSTYMHEYVVDESFYPNVYIWAIAFSKDTKKSPHYAVWYGEIIMDLWDKKSKLTITPDSQQYTNGDEVRLDISLQDNRDNPLVWEVEIMVVDESLIRLLGNIDLDIIPNFFSKHPFTLKTALTLIWLERNRFLSRLWSNGWGGNKWWDGLQISSRTRFKNTAYYNPSILTDKNGKATVKFTLPDNVTNYRIIGIAQTKKSQFGVSEKTINVRRNYTLETHAPYIGYAGDKTTIIASIFNQTSRVTPVTLHLEMGTGASIIKKSQELMLNPSKNVEHTFSINISPEWSGDTPYRLTIVEWKSVLDSIQKSITVPPIPQLANITRISWYTNQSISIPLPKIGANVRVDSPVSIFLSTNPLKDPEGIIQSMISYPYGCVEQIISATMPNAIALKLWKELNITLDKETAQRNIQAGIQKILNMQDPHSGWWKYWEQDTNISPHVTPYVISSLYDFRELWVDIPEATLQMWLDFIVDFAQFSSNPNNINQQAEIFATLARVGDDRAISIKNSINVSQLNRHWYLMYHVWLHYLWMLDPAHLVNLKKRMNFRDSQYYWYWSDTADLAIYARLLYRIWWEEHKRMATKIITELLKDTDPQWYYVSTQEKLQLFLTLVAMHDTVSLSNVHASSDQYIFPQIVDKTSRHTYTVERSKLSDNIDITMQGSGELFYEVLIKNLPVDIFASPAQSHPDMTVERIFETIDESKWLDENGQFIATTPMKDMVFKKWKLYKVKIRIQVKNVDTKKYHLTLEDFMPGWWRPIRWIFKTESSALKQNDTDNYWYWNRWDHVAALQEKILATRNVIYPQSWNDKSPQIFSYTYYIRPEHTGTYLLPPVTAYYMYQPDIHAIGTYQKITIQ